MQARHLHCNVRAGAPVSVNTANPYGNRIASASRLSPQWPVGMDRRRRVHWLCLCQCGNLTIVSSSNLSKGVLSCGCLNRERIAESNRLLKTRHGYAKKRKISREFMSYSAAKKRCQNPNDKDFKNYGGRGIKFLFASFQEFLSELGDCPNGLMLDRINNEGHYEKGNVRWTTITISNHNRRKPRRR